MLFAEADIKKILRNKKKIEVKLNVSLNVKGNNIELSGKEIDKFTAEKVLNALADNFPSDIAFLLVDEDFVLEHIPIKDFTKKKNLQRVRGRIIGAGGRTLEILQELAECYITLKENIVNIIGSTEKIKFAENAVKSLIQGSKTANVYDYLEKSRGIHHPEDLGLKEDFKKKIVSH